MLISRYYLITHLGKAQYLVADSHNCQLDVDFNRYAELFDVILIFVKFYQLMRKKIGKFLPFSNGTNKKFGKG